MIKSNTPIVAPIVYGPITITVPMPTFAPVPCAACSCTGIYVDYGGPHAPGVAVACRACGGKGWLPAPSEPLRPRTG